MTSTMGSVISKTVAIPVAVVTFLSAHAYGHEGHHDAAMQKLHKIMPIYAQAESAVNEALRKGDASAVETECGKILATIADLKRSKPHKNLKAIGTYRKLASGFAGDVKKTADLAKTGDIAGAKGAFERARKGCNDCHAKFRD